MCTVIDRRDVRTVHVGETLHLLHVHCLGPGMAYRSAKRVWELNERDDQYESCAGAAAVVPRSRVRNSLEQLTMEH